MQIARKCMPWKRRKRFVDRQPTTTSRAGCMCAWRWMCGICVPVRYVYSHVFGCVFMSVCACVRVCNPLNQSKIAINRPVFTLVRTYTNPCKCQRYFSVFKCRPRLRLLVLSERIVHVQSAHRRGVCVCAQPKIVKFM